MKLPTAFELVTFHKDWKLDLLIKRLHVIASHGGTRMDCEFKIYKDCIDPLLAAGYAVNYNIKTNYMTITWPDLTHAKDPKQKQQQPQETDEEWLKRVLGIAFRKRKEGTPKVTFKDELLDKVELLHNTTLLGFTVMFNQDQEKPWTRKGDLIFTMEPITLLDEYAHADEILRDAIRFANQRERVHPVNYLTSGTVTQACHLINFTTKYRATCEAMTDFVDRYTLFIEYDK